MSITSKASDVELMLMERVAGSNPEGSRISQNERLNLLYLITVMNQGGTGPQGQAGRDEILRQLEGRNFTPEQLAEVFSRAYSPLEAVDALCKHPSMAPDYLD